MCELNTGPKRTLNGTDPECYYDFHVVPLDTNQKERATVGTWRGITSHTAGWRGSLDLVGCPPRRGELR